MRRHFITSICIFMYIYIYTLYFWYISEPPFDTHIHVYIHVCVCVCLHTYIHIHSYPHVCVHTKRACIHTYIYVYTQTCTHSLFRCKCLYLSSILKYGFIYVYTCNPWKLLSFSKIAAFSPHLFQGSKHHSSAYKYTFIYTYIHAYIYVCIYIYITYLCVSVYIQQTTVLCLTVETSSMRVYINNKYVHVHTQTHTKENRIAFFMHKNQTRLCEYVCVCTERGRETMQCRFSLFMKIATSFLCIYLYIHVCDNAYIYTKREKEKRNIINVRKWKHYACMYVYIYIYIYI